MDRVRHLGACLDGVDGVVVHEGGLMQRRYVGPSNVGDMWTRPECWEPAGVPEPYDSLIFKAGQSIPIAALEKLGLVCLEFAERASPRAPHDQAMDIIRDDLVRSGNQDLIGVDDDDAA